MPADRRSFFKTRGAIAKRAKPNNASPNRENKSKQSTIQNSGGGRMVHSHGTRAAKRNAHQAELPTHDVSDTDGEEEDPDWEPVDSDMDAESEAGETRGPSQSATGAQAGHGNTDGRGGNDIIRPALPLPTRSYTKYFRLVFHWVIYTWPHSIFTIGEEGAAQIKLFRIGSMVTPPHEMLCHYLSPAQFSVLKSSATVATVAHVKTTVYNMGIRTQFETGESATSTANMNSQVPFQWLKGLEQAYPTRTYLVSGTGAQTQGADGNTDIYTKILGDSVYNQADGIAWTNMSCQTGPRTLDRAPEVIYNKPMANDYTTTPVSSKYAIKQQLCTPPLIAMSEQIETKTLHPVIQYSYSPKNGLVAGNMSNYWAMDTVNAVDPYQSQNGAFANIFAEAEIRTQGQNKPTGPVANAIGERQRQFSSDGSYANRIPWSNTADFSSIPIENGIARKMGTADQINPNSQPMLNFGIRTIRNYGEAASGDQSAVLQCVLDIDQVMECWIHVREGSKNTYWLDAGRNRSTGEPLPSSFAEPEYMHPITHPGTYRGFGTAAVAPATNTNSAFRTLQRGFCRSNYYNRQAAQYDILAELIESGENAAASNNINTETAGGSAIPNPPVPTQRV